MEKRTDSKGKNKKGGLKARSQKLKAGILKSYYGNPIKDMKLIAITGTTGKVVVAHYVHEILRGSGEQVAVLASDQPFKLGMLHKFLSDAWKAGANYVIVTVPASTLRDNVFYGFPVHVAAMTNFATASLKDMTPEEYLDSEKTLFDMKPEMSAVEITDALLPVLGQYDVVILNWANGDMVGHTGNEQATIRAIEVLDAQLSRLVPAVLELGGVLLITADHGNAEKLWDEENNLPWTAHTTNPVNIIVVADNAPAVHDGGLADIAPTILKLLDIEQPKEMTGHSLI